jgi:hypothetical protein
MDSGLAAARRPGMTDSYLFAISFSRSELRRTSSSKGHAN